MAMREIPASYEHKCDGCGKLQNTTSKSRPSYWGDLILAQDAYDFQGAAVADGTIRRLLCSECKDVVSAAINAAIRSRAALDKGVTT